MTYRNTILSGTWAVLIGLGMVYSAQTGGVLRATPGQYDFGIIDEGEPAVTTVKIENVGNAPIEITGVRTN